MRALLLLLLATVTALGADVDPRLPRFAEELERRLDVQLRLLAGEAGRLSAAIHLVESRKPVARAGNGSMDLAYVPVPVDVAGTAPLSKAVADDSPLRIERAEVTLLADETLPEPIVTAAKDLSAKLLKPFTVTVNVQRLPPLPSVAELSPFERFRSTQLFFGLLVAAVLVGAALSLVGVFLRRSAGDLREAMSALTAEKSETAEPIVPETAPVAPAADKAPASSGPRPAEGAIRARDYASNLRLLRQTLLDSPRLLVQAFDATAGDAAGIRWLLPKLDDEAQEALQKTLPAPMLTLIGARGAGENDDSDRLDWLQRFCERLAVRKIEGTSALDTSLGAERLLRLSRVPTEKLVAHVLAASPKEAPSGWRLLLETLKKDDLKRVLERLSPEGWAAMAQAAERTPAEVVSFTDTALKALEKGERTGATEGRVDLVSNYLVEPLLALVGEKDLGEDDTFIEELEGRLPAAAAALRQRLWTPRSLSRVPPAAIEAAFKGLSTAQKALLVAAFPAARAERFERLLPEGNLRTMVVDQARKLRANSSLRERRAVREVGRRFLESLRRAASDGAFELLPESTDSDERKAA